LGLIKQYKAMKDINKINYTIAAMVSLLGFIAIYMAASKPTENTQKPITQEPKPISAVVKNYDGWAIKCLQNDSSRNSRSGCYGEKTIQDQTGAQISAQVMLIDRGGRFVPRLKVTVPFGIFLPAGLSLTLPAQEEFTVPVQFCEGQGCYINLDLADDVVQELSNSDTLRVSYLLSSRETSAIDLPLSGFFDSLKHLKRAESE